MIYIGSRYEDVNVSYIQDGSSRTVRPTVLRDAITPPTARLAYRWRERDRIDTVAKEVTGASGDWWRMLDANTEVLNPLYLRAGQQLVVE